MDQVVKIRVILDVEEDIFRDIEIELDAPLMHLHLSTLDAFNWDNANEMASFYQSNEAWDKGTEYRSWRWALNSPPWKTPACATSFRRPRRAVYMSTTT